MPKIPSWLFVAASVSHIRLYAFIPKDRMLTVKLTQDSSENIPWKEIIEEEEKHEILEKKRSFL